MQRRSAFTLVQAAVETLQLIERQNDLDMKFRAGWVLFLFYIGAFWFYFYVRVDKTLNLGRKYTWYGIVLLCVECMGATTVVIYGINLLYNPVHESFLDDERQPGCPKVNAEDSLTSSAFL